MTYSATKCVTSLAYQAYTGRRRENVPSIYFPDHREPHSFDIDKAVQLVEQMADIIKMARMSPMGHDRPDVIFDTVEQNLRFASDVLKKGLPDSGTEIMALSSK